MDTRLLHLILHGLNKKRCSSKDGLLCHYIGLVASERLFLTNPTMDGVGDSRDRLRGDRPVRYCLVGDHVSRLLPR